jgi:hypothetical protein
MIAAVSYVPAPDIGWCGRRQGRRQGREREREGRSWLPPHDCCRCLALRREYPQRVLLVVERLERALTRAISICGSQLRTMRQHARPLCRQLLGAGRRDHAALAEAFRGQSSGGVA